MAEIATKNFTLNKGDDEGKGKSPFVKQSPFLRYSVAVLAVALTLGLKLLLAPLFIHDTPPFLLFFVAIMISALYGGLGPGLLATVLAALIASYFFLYPGGSFPGLSLEITPLIVFVLEGSLISSLAAALRFARQRAEDGRERLRQSEERFRLLVEGVEDYAILMLDPSGHIMSWNAGAERMYGYRAVEIVGEHFSRLYTEEALERDHPEEELRAALADGRHEEEGLRVRKDGSRFWASVSITALSDESGNRRGFSKVVRDVTERKSAEQRLRETLDRLLALHRAGEEILGWSLKQEEIGERLLEIVRRVSGATAAVIELRDGRERWHPLCAVGLEDLGNQARSTPGARAARRAALDAGEPRVFRTLRSAPSEEHLWVLCLPLTAREQLVGLLEVYSPRTLNEPESVETLASLAGQGASALENARLYEELAERELRLRDLVGRILVTQEEERRHVAYEVHDGFTQMAISAYQLLQNIADEHPQASAEATKELEEAIDRLEQTIKEARRVIANLRPVTLDDLGLASAIRQQVDELRVEGVEVGYEEALGEERLPPELEITLFRIVQEALTNVRKHANTERAHVALERVGGSVRLCVRDWGRSFRPTTEEADRGGPGERVGISSMRERAALLGGALKVRSKPGSGTLVRAEIPLPRGEEETSNGG